MQVTDHSPWVGALTGGMERLGGHSLRTQRAARSGGSSARPWRASRRWACRGYVIWAGEHQVGTEIRPHRGSSRIHTGVPHCFLVGGALAPLQGLERGSEKHSVAPRET